MTFVNKVLTRTFVNCKVSKGYKCTRIMPTLYL